ncbi:MAG: hypothetical protein H9Q65_01080 [Spiroplasma ixodetis]|nr:hypothetical protein [Spiroplasma ixodetis]
MKPILSKAISNIVKQGAWITRDEPLHQNKEKIQRELITGGCQSYEIIYYHISNLFPKMNYLKNNEN